MPAVLDFNQPDTASTAGDDLATTSSALVLQLGDSSTIATVDDLDRAVRDRQQLADAIRRVEAFFDPLKRMANQLHKALCQREKSIVAPLRELDDRKRHAMGSFALAQDRARRDAEQQLVEQQRRQREADAVAEAAQLEHAGEHAIAAAVVAEAIAAPPPVVVLPDLTKTVVGFKTRRLWKWRYVGDKTRALALLPRDFLIPDEAKIGSYAHAMKDSAKLPGIEFYAEDLPVR